MSELQAHNDLRGWYYRGRVDEDFRLWEVKYTCSPDKELPRDPDFRWQGPHKSEADCARKAVADIHAEIAQLALQADHIIRRSLQ